MPELERIYTIPLRREWEKVPPYRRAKKAAKAIREFLVRHMKLYDRDMRKVKIGKWLNEKLWERGIKKPPIKVRVKAVKDENVVKVELAELPKKALKTEKNEGEAKEAKKKEKGKENKKEKVEVKIEETKTEKKEKK